jgi:hypothetical protein
LSEKIDDEKLKCVSNKKKRDRNAVMIFDAFANDIVDEDFVSTSTIEDDLTNAFATTLS